MGAACLSRVFSLNVLHSHHSDTSEKPLSPNYNTILMIMVILEKNVVVSLQIGQEVMSIMVTSRMIATARSIDHEGGLDILPLVVNLTRCKHK